MTGFLVHDYKDRFGEAISQLSAWIEAGSLVSREHVLEGIEHAPGAIRMLYRGENTDKLIIRLDQGRQTPVANFTMIMMIST